MIKPVNNSQGILSVKKRTQTAQNEKPVQQSQKTRSKDRVQISDEALSALQMDQLVEQVKALPDISQEAVAAAKEHLQQDDYFEQAADSFAEDFSSALLAAL